VTLAPGGIGELTAPVAVRVLDLDAPLDDLDLSYHYMRHDYRSLLAVVRIGEHPIGVATFPVDPRGYVTRDQLAGGLHRQLGAELSEAIAIRDRERKPDSSVGIPEFPYGAGIPELPYGADIPELPYGAGVPELPCGADIALGPSVSVVVPTCCNPEPLERCLRSILQCEYDDFEVIVVENRPGSSDTARMLVERFPGERRLRYVEEPRPSASLARNAGLASSEGEIVAFTDDDVVVDPLWLRASVGALLSGDGVACVTGLILPLELESESQLLLEQFASFGKGFQRKTYRLPDSLEENPLLPYTAGAPGSGASIVMLTEVARDLGGFDPALGPATPAKGGEDLDLLVRVLRTGQGVSYEPRAIVWREHPEGSWLLRRQVYRYGVGLGAMLGKQLIAGPQRRDFLRAVPAGLRYLRNPGSRKKAGKPANYPRRLTWLKRLGMLVGPIAYLVSAVIVRARRLRRRQPPSPRSLRIVRRMVVGGETINVAWFREAPAPRVRLAWRRAAEHDTTGPSVQLVPASAIAIPAPARSATGALRITAVVPARNAEAWIESCLRAIRANGPAEVILVDGGSTDRTVELARPWVDTVLDDGGAGVAAARMLGVVSASQPWIALVDADVVLPPNALRDLDRERCDRQLGALQAGLRSVGAGDYWSQSLADHHNHGQSKGWFGVCASLIARDILLAYPLDAQLRSGEDIDLRIRLTRAGFPIGVSEAMITEHRFGDGFAFARDQWTADGAGLGRMVRKHGTRALVNTMMPFGAAALGIVRGMRDRLRSWPYFFGFAIGNYIGLWRGLLDRSVPATRCGHRLLVASMLLWLLALPAVLAVAATAFALLMLGLGHAAYQGRLALATLAIFAVAIPFEVGRGAESGRFSAIARRIAPFTAWAMALGLILSGVRLARVVGL
jgi:glycosyltransferase involved in cell wall biosynthesis